MHVVELAQHLVHGTDSVNHSFKENNLKQTLLYYSELAKRQKLCSLNPIDPKPIPFPSKPNSCFSVLSQPPGSSEIQKFRSHQKIVLWYSVRQ